MIATPCTGICSTAVGDEVCLGCGRTFAEVSDWLAMDDAARDHVMAMLSRRKVWLSIAQRTGGRLAAPDGVPESVTLHLGVISVCLGWPQERNGQRIVPMCTHDGRAINLIVSDDDWLAEFWSAIFD